MPVTVYNILADVGPYSEPDVVLATICYRCKQVKDVDGFTRCYGTGKHSYCYAKYSASCSECLDKSVK